MSDNLTVARNYEAALFAGRMDEVEASFTDDATYWVAGPPGIGGTWKGPKAIVKCFTDREFGLGDADWGYEEIWREWKSGDGIVTVEIREKSWLKSSPDDVMDQRTCVVMRFRDGRICDMRDYTDSNLYVQFVKRHPELPKFARIQS